MSIEEHERALHAVYERISAGPMADHADRVFMAIWVLEAELNNGGFSQWMFNSSGDSAAFAVAALREVGAEQAARVCEQLFALLPGGAPHVDREQRQVQLEAAEAALGPDEFERACGRHERAFYALEDELRDLLLRYVQRRP